MKHLNKIIGALIIISFSSFNNLKAQNDTSKVIILHTNDMHAKIDNMSKLAYYIDYYKNNFENVFVFSAGDNFTGNPIVDQYTEPGFPIIDLMNKLHYDLSCIGNHEFDYGQQNLNKRREQANFPFLSANIITNEGADLIQPKAYQKLKTKNGTSIGVFSVTQVNRQGIPDCSPMKVKHLTFNNPIETAIKYKSYKDSSDIFIALTHLGYTTDLKLAKKAPFFDAIIGGHSHTYLPTGFLKGNTLITQADSYVEYLGVMTLELVNHVIISKKDTLIALDNKTKINSEIQDIIDKYNDNPSLSVIIGTAEEDLTGKYELGSMLTDAIRDTLNVDIAFQNNGGIRMKKIPKGNITIKQILELSPFGNTLVEYQLSPKQIKRLVKYAYELNESNELQVSGLIINLQITPNNKLKQITLKTPENKELTKKTYSVAINDYMAAAYNLKFLKKGIHYPIIDAENTIQFIKKSKTINYKGVKRIIENQ